MMIGYINKKSIQIENGYKDEYVLNVWPYTRQITEKYDRVKTKGLYGSYDYAEVQENTELIKNNHVMFVAEPFFVDDEEVMQRAARWVEQTNLAREGMANLCMEAKK